MRLFKQGSRVEFLEFLVARVRKSINYAPYLQFYAQLVKLKDKVLYLDQRKDRDDLNQTMKELQELYQSIEFQKFVESLGKQEEDMRQLSRIARVLQKRRGLISEETQNSIDLIVNFSNWCDRTFPTGSRFRKKHPLVELQEKQQVACLAGNVKSVRKHYLRERKIAEDVQQVMQDAMLLANIEGGRIHLWEKRMKRRGRFKRIAAAFFVLILIGTGLWVRETVNLDEINLTYGTELIAHSVDFLETAELEEQFERRFGFNIYGDFSDEDVKVLASCLSKDAVDKMQKAGATKIFISPNLDSQKRNEEGRGAIGHAVPEGFLGRRIRLRSGKITKALVDHEVAHIFHFYIRENFPEFDVLWLQACGQFSAYDQVGFTKESWYHYHDTGRKGVRKGYASSYGGVNKYEDVAEFVEIIKNKPGEFENVTGNAALYEQKIKLLLEYGFISSSEAKKALKILGRSEGGVQLALEREREEKFQGVRKMIVDIKEKRSVPIRKISSTIDMLSIHLFMGNISARQYRELVQELHETKQYQEVKSQMVEFLRSEIKRILALETADAMHVEVLHKILKDHWMSEDLTEEEFAELKEEITSNPRAQELKTAASAGGDN